MANSRTHHHLGGRKLHQWHTIRIEDRPSSDGSINKHVIFTSTIHTRKEVELTFCFSSQYSDAEILRDNQVAMKHQQMYGLDATVCACCGK